MKKNNKKVNSQIINGLLKSLKIIIIFIFSASLLLLVHLFLMPNTCEKNFKIYPEKGYCEFNLKTCEGLFGCKEYENERVSCGSISALCGEEVLCDCGKSNSSQSSDEFVGVKWYLERAYDNEGEAAFFRARDAFAISFTENGDLFGLTDCNNFSAKFEKDGNNISFGPFLSTEMYCEGSEEDAFKNSLAAVEEFTLDGGDKLILKSTSTSLVFLNKDTAQNTKNWNLIKEAATNCNIIEAGQTHDRRVRVELKSGEIIEAFSPEIDSIFKVIDNSKKTCGKVLLWTE